MSSVSSPKLGVDTVQTDTVTPSTHHGSISKQTDLVRLKLAAVGRPAWSAADIDSLEPYMVRNTLFRMLLDPDFTFSPIVEPAPEPVSTVPEELDLLVSESITSSLFITPVASPRPLRVPRRLADKPKNEKKSKAKAKAEKQSRAKPSRASPVRKALPVTTPAKRVVICDPSPPAPVSYVLPGPIDATPLRDRPVSIHGGTVHSVLAGRVHTAYATVLEAVDDMDEDDSAALAELADAVEEAFGVDFRHLSLENRLRQTLLDLGAPTMAADPVSPIDVSGAGCRPGDVMSSFRRVCSSTGRSERRRGGSVDDGRLGILMVHAALEDAVRGMAELDGAVEAERGLEERAMSFISQFD